MDFSRVVSAWMRASLAAGSGSPIGRRTSRVAIRLPSSRSSPGRRMLIGTRPTSCSGVSSARRSNSRRRPPAAIERITSFTVAPESPRIALSWASSASTKATRRSRPISWLRKVRGAVGPAGGELREALGGAHHPAGGRAWHRQRPAGRLARRTQRRPDAVGGVTDEQQLRARLVGLPALLGHLHLGSLGARVEDDRADVDRGDPVDERVVGLRDEGVALALEPLDQIELPQRPGQVERLGHHPPDQLAQLRGAAGLRQRDPAHVALDVEARVVGPDRVVEGDRAHRGDLLAKARDQAQPRLDMVDEALELRRLARDDDRRADVDVDRPSLSEQRGHVRGREAVVHSPAAAGPAAMNSSRPCLA